MWCCIVQRTENIEKKCALLIKSFASESSKDILLQNVPYFLLKAHFLRKLEVIIGPTRIYTREYSDQWVFFYFFFQIREIIATHEKCVIFIIDCFESYFKLTLRWLWWLFCWWCWRQCLLYDKHWCVDFDNVDEDNICCTTNKRWYVAR